MKRIARYVLASVVLIGCGPDPIRDRVTYEDLVLEGWVSYSTGDYEDATVWFDKAVKKDSTFIDAFTGLAWSSIQLGLPDDAQAYFERGLGKINTKADHYGGWAFLAHDFDFYETSNSYADSALAADPTWSFPYAAGIGAASLALLKAWNYFLLGDFNQSLLAVKAFNPSFTADVSTAAGQQLLAKEIERLRGLSKATAGK